MSTDAAGPFKVEISTLVGRQFRVLVQKAKSKGLAAEMLQAARHIIARLQRDPLAEGEAQYNLGPPTMTMCLIAANPLAVHYGVLLEQRVVMVQEFRSTVDLDG